MGAKWSDRPEPGRASIHLPVLTGAGTSLVKALSSWDSLSTTLKALGFQSTRRLAHTSSKLCKEIQDVAFAFQLLARHAWCCAC